METTLLRYELTPGELAAFVNLSGNTPADASPLKELLTGVTPTPQTLAAHGVLDANDHTKLREECRFIAAVLCDPATAMATVFVGLGRITIGNVYVGPGEGVRPAVALVTGKDKISLTFLPTWEFLLAIYSDLLALDASFPTDRFSLDLSAEEYTSVLALADARREQQLEQMQMRLLPDSKPLTSSDIAGALSRSLRGQDGRWAVTAASLLSPVISNLAPDALDRLLMTMSQKGWIKLCGAGSFRTYTHAAPLESAMETLAGLISSLTLAIVHHHDGNTLPAGVITLFRASSGMMVALPAGIGTNSLQVNLSGINGAGALEIVAQFLRCTLGKSTGITSPPSPIPPAAPSAPAPAKSFCRKCGSPLKPDARFCAKCGTPA